MVDPFRAAQNFFGGAAQSIGDVPVSFLDLFGQDEIARKWERKIAETFPAEPGAASFIGQVAGSLLPTLPAVWLQGAGLATKLPQLYRAARVGGLGVYGAQSAGQGRRDVRRFEEETGEDVSPAEEALTALGYGALTLATESYGMQNILGNIGDIDRRSMALLGKHISKGNVRGGARHLLNLSRRAALASTEEGLQELTEQTSQDLLSKLVYDTDRSVLENAGQAFLGGMVGGGIAHGIGMAATRWDSRPADFFSGKGKWTMYASVPAGEMGVVDPDQAREAAMEGDLSASPAAEAEFISRLRNTEPGDYRVTPMVVDTSGMFNPLDVADVSRAWPVLGEEGSPSEFVSRMRELEAAGEDIANVAVGESYEGLEKLGFTGALYTKEGVPKISLFSDKPILNMETPVTAFAGGRMYQTSQQRRLAPRFRAEDTARVASEVLPQFSGPVGASPSVNPAYTNMLSGLVELLGLTDAKIYLYKDSDVLEESGDLEGEGLRTRGEFSNYKYISNEATTLVAEGYEGLASDFGNGVYSIGLTSRGGKSTRHEIVRSLAHEIGHVVQYHLYSTASPETKKAIESEFTDFSARMVRNGVRADRIQFDEWFANGVMHWAFTEEKPKGIVERFFKRVAEKLKLLYKKFPFGYEKPGALREWLNSVVSTAAMPTRLYQTAQQPPSRLHPQLAGKSREEASKFLSSLSSREVSKIAKDLRIGAVRGGKENAIKMILWDQYDAGDQLSRIRGYQTAQQPPRFTFRSTQVLTDPKTQRRANGQQWAGLLKKLGVTKEEMQWTGLGAELERGKQNFYTKEDLLGIVAAKGMTLAQQHQIWMTEEAYKPGERVVAVSFNKPEVSSSHSQYYNFTNSTNAWNTGVRLAEARKDPFGSLEERLNVIERAWNGEFIAGIDPVTGKDYDKDFLTTMDSETWTFIPVPKVGTTGKVHEKDNRFSVLVKFKRGKMVGGKVPVLVETKITRAPKGAYGLPPRNLLTFGDLERVISNDVTMTGKDSIERAKKLVEDDFSKNPTNVLLPQRVGNLEIERDQSRTFTHVFPGKITNAFIMAVTLDPATHGMMFQVDAYHGMGGRKNQIGYVRVTERLDEDGNRHLVVEEIQSNWYTQMSVLKSVIRKLERKGYRLDKLEEYVDDMEDRIQSLSAEESEDYGMMERLKDQLTEIGFESRMFSMEDLRIYAQGEQVTKNYKDHLDYVRNVIVGIIERGRSAGTPEGKRLENIATSLLINVKPPGSQYNPTIDDLTAAIGVIDRARQRITDEDVEAKLLLLREDITNVARIAPTHGGRHVAGYRLPPVPENPFGDNWYKHVVKNLVAQLSKQGYRSIYFTHDDFQKAYQHMDNVKTLDMYRNGLGEFLTKYAEDWGGVYTPDAAFMVDTEAQTQFRPTDDPALPEEKNALRKFAQIFRKDSQFNDPRPFAEVAREALDKLRKKLAAGTITPTERNALRAIEDMVSRTASVTRTTLEQMWQTQTHEPPWGPDDDYSRAKGSGWATTSGLSDPTVRAIRNLNVVKLSHLFIKESMAEKLEAEEQLFFQTQGREPMMSNEQRDLFADHLRNSGLVAQVVVSPTPLTKPDGTEVNAYAELIPGTANSFRIVLGPRIQTNTAGHELFEVFAALLPENDPMLARGRRIMESLGFRDSPGLPGHWKEALADVVGRVYYQRKMRAGIYQRVVGWLQDFWTHVKNWARVQLSAEDIARLLNERMAQGVGGVVGGRIPNADWSPIDEVIDRKLEAAGLRMKQGESLDQFVQRVMSIATPLVNAATKEPRRLNKDSVHSLWDKEALNMPMEEKLKAIGRVISAKVTDPVSPVDAAVYWMLVDQAEKRVMLELMRGGAVEEAPLIPGLEGVPIGLREFVIELGRSYSSIEGYVKETWKRVAAFDVGDVNLWAVGREDTVDLYLQLEHQPDPRNKKAAEAFNQAVSEVVKNIRGMVERSGGPKEAHIGTGTLPPASGVLASRILSEVRNWRGGEGVKLSEFARSQLLESLKRRIAESKSIIHPATRSGWGLSYWDEHQTMANMLNKIINIERRITAAERRRLYQAIATGDLEAVDAVIREVDKREHSPTVGDQIYALYYNSLLSGPPAHLVNTTTNFLWQSWNYGHTALESFLDAIGSTITGKPRQVFVGDVLPRFVGAKRGLPMARKLAGVIWREGSIDKLSEQIEIVRNFDIFGTATVQQADAAIVEIAKILKVPQSEVRSRGFLNAVKAMTEDKFHIEMGTASVTALERGMLKNFPKLAQMITAPSRFMRLADVFAKTLAMDGRMTELLYKKLGSLDAAEKFLKKSYQSMSESEKRMYAEVLEEASYYADLMTFTDRPPRWVKGLIDARNAIPGAKLLIPFITTVTNIARRGLEMTPGLGLYKLGTKEFREGFKRRIEIVDPLGHKTHDKVFVGKGRLTDVLAKQLEGSIIMGLLMWLFDEDRVTAGVPVNPVKREQFYAEGKLPWSIRVGDTWVQYKRWEPFATIFGFVGSVYDALQQASTVEEGTGVFQAAASNFTQYLLDNTFVGGVRDLMTTHSVSDELARVPVGFVPYSSMWSWMKRGIDAWEGKRPLFEKPEDFLGKVKENLRQVDVPGLMEEPPRRLNVWGEEVSIPGGILAQWLPWKFSQADTDPTEAELARLGVYPGPPQNKLTINRREVELPEDLHRQYLLWFGAKAKSEIDRLFRSSRYQGQEKEERKLWMLEGVVRRARELARQRVIREVVRQRRDLLGRGARAAQPATT